ncbi:MAG: hypothetical protein KGQ95_09340 [Acidobacteria bacterium]|nr:hypothetical protein [Acidobacteriota bacterium]
MATIGQALGIVLLRVRHDCRAKHAWRGEPEHVANQLHLAAGLIPPGLIEVVAELGLGDESVFAKRKRSSASGTHGLP